MPFCTECGAQNEATVKFCTACGARLDVVSRKADIASRAIGEAPGLTFGEILVLGGAAVTLISFFLPWFSEPTELQALRLFGGLGGVRARESISGVGLFKVAGASILLVPLLALLAASFVFLFREASRAKRIQAAAWQIFFAATFVIDAIAVLFLPLVPSILSLGFYGLTVGYLGILIGSFLLLNRLAREA